MKLWSARKIKFFISILTPFILIPLAVSEHKESRCGYVLLLMAVYWLLEPVDIAVTALIPVVLMPLLGVLDSNQVVQNYMKEVLMMFLGGLGVAVAVEYCNLHKRIALKVLLTIGSDIKWLMLGFMATAMFLSMWISNSATTAMMVPIIDAVMEALKKKEDDGDEGKEKESGSQEDLKNLHKTLLLCVAFSSNFGGTGTITGTSPNMIFKGFLEMDFPDSHEITYASWMAYNIPGMIIGVFTSWLVLQVVYVPCWRKPEAETQERIKFVIRDEYQGLGRITFHEAGVLSLFVLLVFLWVFREPKFMPGWADMIGSGKQVGDAVPAIGILFLMFLLPAEPWDPLNSPPLLKWRVMQKKLPWGLIILLGSGYAMADGAKESGLSSWLILQMQVLVVLQPAAILSVLCLATTALTQVMSNSTVASILLPVVSQMAISFRINPLYFMLPVTISCTYAFMLPVSTGPNAIVYASGHLKTIDMMKPGIIMNIIGIIIQLFMIHTLGASLFTFSTFPKWANTTSNGTLM